MDGVCCYDYTAAQEEKLPNVAMISSKVSAIRAHFRSLFIMMVSQSHEECMDGEGECFYSADCKFQVIAG